MKQNIRIDDLREYGNFSRLFTRKQHLGEGGDGIVYAYEHNSSKALVAVKTPLTHSSGAPSIKGTKRLEAEIANLTILRQHEHIAGMLAWSHLPVAPAIFLPFCELGDLNNYITKWKHQQAKQQDAIQQVSEVTIWKCLHDMALALDYLHNKHKDSGYTHNDIKPDKILVDIPEGWKPEDGIPDEPIFKLTDFARMTPYPPPKGATPIHFLGTPEFAPLLCEQGGRRPSADIWALGGTLQSLALGLFPIQSREAFVASRRAAGEHAPIVIDEGAWRESYWRHLIPTIFRPLSATANELIEKFDVRENIVIFGFYPSREWVHTPYSKSLNDWYEWLWEVNERERITARMLVKYLVPTIAGKIHMARETEKAGEKFEKAYALREKVGQERQGRGGWRLKV